MKLNAGKCHLLLNTQENNILKTLIKKFTFWNIAGCQL